MSTAWAYRAAGREELERLWEKSVAQHPGDARWIAWRDGAFAGHERGTMQTFAVLAGPEPVGEGTLMFSPECPQIAGRRQLADGAHTANVNGLRIEKPYEGQGHISRMMREMERFARARGIRMLTIGVEAKEARNAAIYRHWGYDRLIHREMEDGELVLYYAKDL